MKLIMAPLPRFINSPCCQVAGHLTNFKGEDYGTNMGESISNLTEWIKEFTHGKRIRNFKVLCPNTMISMNGDDILPKKELAMIWSRDPIHLSSEGCQRLASCIVDELQHPQVQLERLTTGDSTPDETKKRKDWTHKSNMTASRDRRDNLPWHARGCS